MRFYIDYRSENFTKKKSRHMVKFPLWIDMAPYLSEEQRVSSNKPEIYDLKAVLLHRGDSAYSGHYISHCYDERLVKCDQIDNVFTLHSSKSWYKFNDEVVKPLAGTSKRWMFDLQQSDNIAYDPNAPPKAAASSSAKKKPAEETADEDDTVDMVDVEAELYSSKNVYLLSYVRRDGSAQALSRPPEPPSEIMEAIFSINETEEADLASHKDLKQSLTNKFQTARTQRLQFFERWRFDEANDPTVILPTQWLKEWIQAPFTAPSCQNRSKLGDTIFIDGESAIQENSMNGDDVDKENLVEEVTPKQEPTGDDRATGKMVIDTSKIRCAHGRLDVLKLGHVKRVHADAVAYLCDELPCEIKPDILTLEDAICEDCIHSFFDGSSSFTYKTLIHS